MNPLRRLLLGSGRFPDELRTELQAEGAELLVEGMPGSVTFRDFRAPGRYSKWKKQAMSGALALTATRLVMKRSHGPVVTIPIDSELFRDLAPELEAPDRLCLHIDASALGPRASGKIEARFRTDQAERIVERLPIVPRPAY